MTTVDRRGFIQTTAAALAGAADMLAVPGRVAAGPTAAALASAGSTPGFYRFGLGDFTITVLADGSFHLPAEIFGANVNAEELAVYYESRLLPLDEKRLPANPVVIDTGTGRVLDRCGDGRRGRSAAVDRPARRRPRRRRDHA